VLSHDSLRLFAHGGVLPYLIRWPRGWTENLTEVESVLPGMHHVLVEDASGCKKNASVVLRANKLCERLDLCLTEKDPSCCLRKLASPALWGGQMSCCSVLAALSAADFLRTRALEEGDESDFAATFLAIELGNIMQHETWCQGSATVERDVVSLLQPSIRELYLQNRGNFSVFRNLALNQIIFGSQWEPQAKPPNILTVGPFGFDNEPIIAPGLALPTRIATVVVLGLKAFQFPSSSVVWACFPWTLQSDVVLAALFVRTVARVAKADWILPTDSAGILVIAKLASELFSGPRLAEDNSVRDALSRSAPFPHVYPPPHLSKLIPGHEAFSPREAIVSNNDGLGDSKEPLLPLVERAWAVVGPFGYAKREFSEASRGVARDDEGSPESALRAVMKVFPRCVGVSSMDLELKVAIFLQEEIRLDSGVMPVGMRFFARAGQILAAHVSVAVESNIVYETVRDKIVEESTCDFVKGLKNVFILESFFTRFYSNSH
jgi:hypothetical protein